MTVRKRRKPRLTPQQQQLVEANRALAYHAADYFAERCQVIRRLPRDDRIGAALLGLSEAVRRYRPARGKLSTYAMPWMRHALQREAQHAGVVRLPASVFLAGRDLECERERQIDAAWRARSLDAGPDAIGMQDTDLAEWLERTRPCDLEPEVGGWLERSLRLLGWRDRELLRLRYWEGMTLRQVGEVLGISDSRAQQLEARILERMRRGWRERERKKVRVG